MAANITINSNVYGNNVYGNGTGANGTGIPSPTPATANNSVTINSGNVTGNVFGGYATNTGAAAATDNKVIINDGRVTGDVTGGYAHSNTATATATGNTVEINGGTLSGTVISGGLTDTTSGTAGDAFTGNILNLNYFTLITKAQNFETINFGSITNAGILTLDTTPTGVTGTPLPLVKLNTDTNNITFGGVITGDGGIDKRGTGTLTLISTNTYNGDTIITEGTLQIGGGSNRTTGTLGNSPSVTIKNAGHLSFNRSNEYEFSGKIVTETTGKVTQDRNGKTILSGDNSGLTGIVEVNAGTLQIGQGSNHSSIKNAASITVGANSQLAFNMAGEVFDNVITGGGFRQVGGKTTFSKDQTYTGGTTIDAGTQLQIGNGGTAGSVVGDITDNGELIFNRGDTVSYGGVISGNGSLTKTGAGTLTLSGNNIYTGLTEVKDGILALSGSGNISDKLALYGGTTFNTGGATLSLSQLDVRGSATYNGDLNTNGGTMNFYVPETMGKDETMLNVTGTANIDHSQVNIGITGTNPVLQAGEQIVLIKAGTLNDAPTNTASNGYKSGMQGVSLNYDFDIDISANGNQLLATVAKVGLNEQTKSFSEARLSQLAFINQGSDLIAEQGLSAALDATARRTNMKETTTFGAISGGSSRYKTGSHSDVTGLSLITGLAGNSRLTLGKLTLGAFFEYGNANYDSYNSFTNAASVRGKGGIDYTGGGVLAHFEFNPTARGNAWLESSARFGRATVDFQTNDMTGNLGKRTAFDSDSNYAGAHIGAGYHWKLTKQNAFDLYAQYLWSQQNADTVTLTTGETVRFETANSERLRLGSRFVYNLNPHRRAFAGIAWEHEFDGEANASVWGYKLDTPKLTGDTCKLELGLTLKPTKTCPLTRNFGIQGYTGKREGVAGSVEVRYAF